MWKIVGLKVQPIERIRASDCLRVQVDATFEAGKTTYQFSGFAVCREDSEESIKTSIANATEDAIKNFEIRLNTKDRVANTSEIIKDLLKPTHATVREKVKVPAGQEEKLNGPADELRQIAVSELCETLGIVPINVGGDNPWTMLEALALIEELKRRVVKLESK